MEDKQQSLKYQRPKASDLKIKDVSEEATTSNANSRTLLAKVVLAFRQGESLGKVGLALIQNPDETCAIIMYKSKANILTNFKLETNKLYKQLEYWQFYDEQSLYWSFSFDSLQDEKEFKENLRMKQIFFKEAQENNQATEQINREASPVIKAQLLATDEENHGHSKKTKNSLIKRMAKMGRPLPTMSTHSNTEITTDYSDSSDTEVIQTPLSLRQKPAIAPKGSNLSSINNNQQLVASTLTLTPSTVPSSAIYPINPLESQYMQMLLTEQRTQGSELRMNINKLENKIEKVLDKLELCDRHDGKQKPEKDDEILELEEKLLVLKKENRKLKQSLQEKLNENQLKDSLHDLQEDLKSVNINHKNDVKQIVKQLIQQLKETVEEREVLEQKQEKSESNNKELQNDLKLKEMQIKDLEKQVNDLKDNEELLKTKLKEMEKEIIAAKETIFKVEKDLLENKQATVNHNATTNALVKSIMNNLYMDIAYKLENSNLANKEQILSLIAGSIRKQTLESLQQSNVK